MRNAALALALCLVAACASTGPASEPRAVEPTFWTSLQALCGQAFEGRLVEGTEPGDAAFGESRLLMHVASCTGDEVRVPLRVGDDRSRTWIVTRTGAGLRLKHDHRHEDGTEDEVSQYGGDSTGEATARQQDFPADDYTARLIPAAATNVWTLELQPGALFAYGLRRGERRFRLEFDLTRPVAP